MGQLSAGAQAPDFELKTLDRSSYRLYGELAKGPVILGFFKSSCPTCEITFPCLQRIYAAAGKVAAARLLGVSQDGATETRRFIEEHGLTFDIMIDEYPYEVSSGYGLEYVPALFIVGTDGAIRLSDWGFRKSTLEQISGVLMAEAGQPATKVFPPNDRLPASRPGCRAKN